MKISIITSPFGGVPPNAIGAVEKRFYDVGQVFYERGHDVSFYCCSGGENGKGTYIHILGYKRSRKLWIDLIKDFFYSLNVLWALKRTDILIINTFWCPILLAFFRKKYKKSFYSVARFPKGQFRFYRYIDGFICPSRHIQKALLQEKPSLASKSIVIPNPVNTEIFTSKNVHKVNDKIEIIYTGRVHPEKGLHILAMAYSQLCLEFDNLTLTIVGAQSYADGGGGDDYITQLNTIVGNHPIQYVDAVRERKELAHIIQNATIYCYPSIAMKGEAFGVAPLEAMALGMPVVISNLECFSDFVISEENALIFELGDNQVESLVCQLKRLICDEALRQRLGTNAACRSLDFSTDKVANLLLHNFESLLKGTKA